MTTLFARSRTGAADVVAHAAVAHAAVAHAVVDAADGPGASSARDASLPIPAESLALLATLDAWAEHGWLRRLDAALARFIAAHSPGTSASPALLLAVALTAQLEGQGHACLPLAELLGRAEGGEPAAALLGWSGDAALALAVVLRAGPADLPAWLAALGASPAVAVEEGTATGLQAQPAALPATRAATQQPAGPATGDWPAHPAAQPGAQPLVLCDDRLYLRRYWTYEQRLLSQVRARCGAAQAVDEGRARHWLDRLFSADSAPAAPAAAAAASIDQPSVHSHRPPAIDWQKAACALALRSQLTLITGGPGTGKTYTAARLLALLVAMSDQPQRLRIALAAPTGKAAARLRQSILGALAALQSQLGDSLPLKQLITQVNQASTLHRLLGARPQTRRFQHTAAHPLAVDVLIVDEASMVHLEMMAALLDALPLSARLVLLGDQDQLASVEAGAVLGDLCQAPAAGRYGPQMRRYLGALTGQDFSAERGDDDGPPLASQTIKLIRSQRFGGAIGALAEAVNAGDTAAAAQALRQPESQQPESQQPAAQRPEIQRAGAAAEVHAKPLTWLSPASPQAVVDLALNGRSGAPGGYRRYLSLLTDPQRLAASADRAQREAWVHAVLQAFDEFRVLCALRDGEWGVAGLNRAIELKLAQAGLLSLRGGEWYEGRPVMVRRNDPGLGVFNGDIGIALRVGGDGGGGWAGSVGAAGTAELLGSERAGEGGGGGGENGPFAAGPASDATTISGPSLRVWFADGPALRSVSVSRLGEVDTAYALTVHKSQGSEFMHTVLVLPGELGRPATRELVYTGITRARAQLTLVSAQPEALGLALVRVTRRSGGLRARLGLGAGPSTGDGLIV